MCKVSVYFILVCKFLIRYAWCNYKTLFSLSLLLHIIRSQMCCMCHYYPYPYNSNSGLQKNIYGLQFFGDSCCWKQYLKSAPAMSSRWWNLISLSFAESVIQSKYQTVPVSIKNNSFDHLYDGQTAAGKMNWKYENKL